MIALCSIFIFVSVVQNVADAGCANGKLLKTPTPPIQLACRRSTERWYLDMYGGIYRWLNGSWKNINITVAGTQVAAAGIACAPDQNAYLVASSPYLIVDKPNLYYYQNDIWQATFGSADQSFSVVKTVSTTNAWLQQTVSYLPKKPDIWNGCKAKLLKLASSPAPNPSMVSAGGDCYIAYVAGSGYPASVFNGSVVFDFGNWTQEPWTTIGQLQMVDVYSKTRIVFVTKTNAVYVGQAQNVNSLTQVPNVSCVEARIGEDEICCITPGGDFRVYPMPM